MPNVMTAQSNIGGTVCDSSVIPFLVPRRKVWLTPAARVPCSNVANIGERKTWAQSEVCTCQNSVREQKPPKMYIYYTSPRDGQTSCKVWLAAGERHRFSNKAKTQNPLKFAGVPHLANGSQMLLSRSSPYCKDIRRIYCNLTSFFPIVATCLPCEDISRQNCAMVLRWRFLT